MIRNPIANIRRVQHDIAASVNRLGEKSAQRLGHVPMRICSSTNGAGIGRERDERKGAMRTFDASICHAVPKPAKCIVVTQPALAVVKTAGIQRRRLAIPARLRRLIASCETWVQARAFRRIAEE